MNYLLLRSDLFFPILIIKGEPIVNVESIVFFNIGAFRLLLSISFESLLQGFHVLFLLTHRSVGCGDDVPWVVVVVVLALEVGLNLLFILFFLRFWL